MILRFLAGALALVVLALATMPAQARHVRHGRHYRVHHHVSQGPMNSPCAGTTYDNDGRVHCAGGGRGIFPSPWEGRGRGSRSTYVRHVPAWNNAPASAWRGERAATIVAHPAGCPRVAFCGCGAAVEIFGAPIRSLWLAANWFRFPRAAPAPGMAAVRAHHVMVIREYLGDGRALVYDANSGRHMTRVHVHSLVGYTIVNPRGG